MTPELDPYVLDALRLAVRQDGECRLVSRAGKPGLISGSGKSAAARRDNLLERLNLFCVSRTAVEGTGKSAKSVEYVTITPEGIRTLFAVHRVESHRELYESAAPAHKSAALEAVLAAAGEALARNGEARAQLAAEESGVLTVVRQVAAERLQAIAVERAALDRCARAAGELQELAGQPSPERDRKPDPVADRRAAPPAAEEDLDYQRDVAKELVFAWQDATSPETREALERVRLNNGLESVGTAGAATPFDGRIHRTDDPLKNGEIAVVDEPGWKLINARGEYLIARARVHKSPSPQEAANARYD